MLNEDGDDQLSVDSIKIRGGDDSIDEDGDKGVHSSKVTPSKVVLLPSNDESMKNVTTVQINTSKISVHETTGPLSDSDVDRIKKMVENLDGVVNFQITNNVIPSVITVSHRSSGVPLRDII